MSYLDQLKGEAHQLREKQSEAELEREQRERYLVEVVHPRMQSLFTFLSELVENLNIVKPNLTISYKISGYGVAHGYGQERYKLSTDSNKRMTQLALTFVCLAPEPIVIECATPLEVQRQKDYLFSHNIRYRCAEVRDERHNVCSASFTLSQEIPVAFHFEVAQDKLAVMLSVHNFIDLGMQRYNFKAEQLDEVFFDRLARFIVRDTNKLLELEITEAQRNELRENLQRQQIRAQQDLERIERLHQRQERIQGQRNARAIVRSALKKVKKNLFDR